MTGLSGAGKSTLATRLSQELSMRGVHVECLDGDEVRKNLSHGLGFSREDRDRNVRRIGWVARMVARSGACAITAAISPYRALRDEIRSKTENFFEVYCECPLDVLTERDPKGLYKRALAGEIKNFTGVDDPYEAPDDPEVHVRTDLLSVDECLEKIIAALDAKGLLAQAMRGRTALPQPFGGEVFEARTARSEEFAALSVSIPVEEGTAEQVRAVASGYFSPVTGFMTQREAVKVKKSQALERGTPWWNQPFVLPIEPKLKQLEEGARVGLQLADRPLGILSVDGVWDETTADGSTQHYVAGQLEAIAASERAAPTARDFRNARKAAGAQSIGCLFTTGEASDTAVRQAKAASTLSDAIVVAVPFALRDSWVAKMGELGLDFEVVGLPASFPFSNERARLVVQKSLGGFGNQLLH